MGCPPKYVLWLAAIGLTACTSDGNRVADESQGPPGGPAVFQDPFPFSENEEALEGPKAYDEQTREFNEQNTEKR